jgi:DUF1365 family protein
LTVSALYTGTVVHQRFRPQPHRLRYRMAQLLVDIDEVDALAGRLRLFSRNRFNLIAFHDLDYGDRSGSDLRGQIEAMLHAAGIDFDGGPIRLLTMPRILGHVFNPISTWFCHACDGSLRATIYEVTNTFGDRHFYAIRADAEGVVVRQTCDKALYVSPFMDMDMRYDFALTPPGGSVSLSVTGSDVEGKLIVASFAGRRRTLNDRALLGLLVGLPFLTLRVVAGIHWEALKLWWKGVGVRRHPEPPRTQLTTGRSNLDNS